MRITLATIVLLSVVAARCGDSASSPSAAINLTGRWSGDFAHGDGAGAMIWQLTQSGSVVTGTMAAPAAGYNGNISATLSGTTLTLTVDFPPGGISRSATCTGTITGTATVGSSTMTGTYGGSDCFGPFVNGRFNLARQ